MKSIFKEHILEQLKDQRVSVGRVGAETTSIHNSCDGSYFFKGTKGEISKLRKHNVDCHDEGLDQSVMKAFDDVKKAHPEAMMTGEWEKNISVGLCTLKVAASRFNIIQNRQQSFISNGQHVKHRDRQNSSITIDYDKILDRFTSTITASQRQNM